MNRDEILDFARHRAHALVDAGELTGAVAEFVGQCRLGSLDPPLHHANITEGVLIAERGEPEQVREWLMKQK